MIVWACWSIFVCMIGDCWIKDWGVCTIVCGCWSTFWISMGGWREVWGCCSTLFCWREACCRMFCACWGCKTICWAWPGGTGGSRIFCNGLWVVVEVFKMVDCTVLEATKLGRLGLVGVDIWDTGGLQGLEGKDC